MEFFTLLFYNIDVMYMKKRVLISYLSYSKLSLNTAYNLYDLLDKNKYDIHLLDISNYFNNKINIFNNYLFKDYKISLLNGLLYKVMNNKIVSKQYYKYSIKCFDSTNLRDYFKKIKPELIICTHYSASYISAYYNKSKLINSKIVNFVTDYTMHESWTINSKEIDKYVVQNDIVKNEFIKKGINPKDIYSYNINTNLDSVEDKNTILKKYSLKKDKKNYLFFADIDMGYEYFKTVCKKNYDINLIVSTGNNKELKSKCEEFIYNNNIKNTLVLGFSKDIYAFINISDIVISKPGSSIINEALLMGKPVIMTNPQNSSEVFNMKYILKNHFGLKARTPISLRRKVKLLNTYSFILNSMKNKIKKQISSNEGSIDLLIESILKE